MLSIGSTRFASDSLLHVSVYRYLGVLLDSLLTFEPHLKANIAHAHKAYIEMQGSMLSANFPLTVLASNVSVRIDPIVLYGMEFCIATPGAEAALNRAQVSWAKQVLNISSSRAGIWTFLVRECGWRLRLGTRMFARAILLKARACLLPPSHPTAQLLRILSGSQCINWLGQVSALQCRADFCSSIPDITVVFAEARIVSARSDASVRRLLLRQYRNSFVTPVLLAYDDASFNNAACSSPWPYGVFDAAFPHSQLAALRLEWDLHMWQLFRAWSVVRVTGRIPLLLFDCGDLVQTLAICPLCGVPAVDISHLFADCDGTFDLYAQWAGTVVTREPWLTLQHLLFGAPPTQTHDLVQSLCARVTFVGNVVKCVCGALCTGVPATEGSEQGM